MGAVVITSVSPLAVRCAAVVVGVRGCRDVIFEEALDITGGGDWMAGPTVLAPIMPPSPPTLVQIPPKLQHAAVAGLRGLPDKPQIYGQIRPLQLRS